MSTQAIARIDAHRHTRELVLDVAAMDEAARRVPAVISTEYPVAREDYLEVLIHDARSVDLTRAPLPLIEQHAHSRLNIGIVENVRIEGGVLRGEIVFGQSARANELWPDVKAGIVRNLSVGYLVLEQRNQAGTVHVTRWQPFEVSLVSVPADPGAGLFRSISMSDTQTQVPARSGATDFDGAVQSERARVAEIRSLAKRHLRGGDGGEALEEEAIASGMTVAEFQKKTIEHLASIDRAAGGLLNRFSQSSAAPAAGESRDFVAAASDALLLRAGMQIATPHAAARDFRGMSVLEMARACVHRSGRMMGGETPQAMLRSAMSTSDFPALLGDSLGKALRNGMENEPASHRAWCTVSTAADFRTQTRVILGSAPDLEEVLELGEYTNGPLADDKTTLVPVKYGRIVSLSWESMLADNLGGFLSLGRSLGQAAMRTEADALYGALVSNTLAGPTLADGLALFHADRNNTAPYASGSAHPITVEGLAAARTKLRRQVNVGGGVLNLTPRFLIVPPEREMEAEMLVAKSTVHRGPVADANPVAWVAGLTIIAEPRLVDLNTFYLVADQSAIGTGEVAIVDDSPHIEEFDEPRRDVFSWKVRHAFAAGFVDFRGIVKGTITT
jgi:phage major head subunit gpT-like protein